MVRVPPNATLLALALSSLSLLFFAQPIHAAEKQPEPFLKLPLDKLGFPGVSAGFLEVGASVLTVNLLDDTHLLVTFGTRGLVPRVVGDPDTHEDRLVAGEVVELPTGKILARTEWHMHDHARYLWPLGRGRFLVRIGDTLSLLAPMATLKQGDAFRRIAFPGRNVAPVAVIASADGAVLTVETQIKIPGAVGDGDRPGTPKEAMIDIYRLHGDGSDANPLTVTPAKAMRSPRPLLLPINGDGLLWATDKTRNEWSMTFDDFNGHMADMGPLHSTCEPRLQLVSKSQYLALSCRGADDKLLLGAYGFDGHEQWEETFSGFSALAFAYAPEAGRFAMSRTLDAVPPGDINSAGVPQKQEVRIYQTESGDLLLKAQCTPVFKTAENFDMTPDGRTVAVVRDGAIVLYKLGAPTARDRKDLAEVAKFAPPPAEDKPIELTRIAVSKQPGAVASKAVAQEETQLAAPVETPIASEIVQQTEPTKAGAEGTAPTAGDDSAHRPRPTLLNPGEKPEFQDKPPKPPKN